MREAHLGEGTRLHHHVQLRVLLSLRCSAAQNGCPTQRKREEAGIFSVGGDLASHSIGQGDGPALNMRMLMTTKKQ